MKISNLTNWLASRARIVKPTVIVLHATDGASAGSSISWLRKIGLSYHYVIERDGSITKCVPTSRVAFHAGKSIGPYGANVNEYSIGIAFANHESKGERLTTAQVSACEQLVHDLKKSLPIMWVTRHLDISPGRKKDPSMLTKAYYEYVSNGLPMWEP